MRCPSLTSNYWGASGLNSWTTSLLCLSLGITRFCHSETCISYHCYADDTQLYLSFHPDDPTIDARISLSNRHFLLDKGPSPSTHPCQDRTACVFIKPIVSSQFHHTVRHIDHNFFQKQPKILELWLTSWLSQTTLLKLSSPADLLYLSRSGPFFQNMLHNSLFRLLFCPGWTIAMLSWQVFQPVLSRDASIRYWGSVSAPNQSFSADWVSGQTRPIQIRSCAFKLIIFCVVVKPHGSHTNTIKHHTVFMHYISSVLKFNLRYRWILHSLNSSLREILSPLRLPVCHPPFSSQTARRVRLLQLNSPRAHSYWGLKLFKEKAQTRLAAIDGDDGYTGVKPQHRYVTCPPWHRPSPSFRFFL